MIHVIHAYESGTWLEPERDGPRRARVLFPDGELRIVRCAGVADTFFSIHCYPYKGQRGYIGSDEGTLEFRPTTVD